jgi:hypothetical protein
MRNVVKDVSLCARPPKKPWACPHKSDSKALRGEGNDAGRTVRHAKGPTLPLDAPRREFDASHRGCTGLNRRWPPSRCFQTDCSHHRHQLLSRDPQVRQCKQRDDVRGILGQSAQAQLRETELALDDAKRLFELRANAGPAVFGLPGRCLLATVGESGHVAGARRDRPSLGILGRTWSGDDRGIDDVAALEQQALSGQVRVDGLEDVLGQTFPSAEPTDPVENMGLIRPTPPALRRALTSKSRGLPAPSSPTTRRRAPHATTLSRRTACP